MLGEADGVDALLGGVEIGSEIEGILIGDECWLALAFDFERTAERIPRDRRGMHVHQPRQVLLGKIHVALPEFHGAAAEKA